MSYLLDTNVLSELRKRSPHAAVAAWLETTKADDLHMSVLVIGEVRRGIERLRARDTRQAHVFEQWLQTLKRDYRHRILPVSPTIAETWGRLSAPRPLPVIDSLLAATAIVHDLSLVTRDTSTLQGTGASLLNPWQFA